MQDPNSLCARVLKAKYFPNTSVLEARQKTGMSYTWRSILHGFEIKKGMIWRVGDGVGLNIWNDPWLPRDSVRKPLTPRGATLLTDVEELMDPVTGSWDTTLVKDIFWEEDAEIILALPVHGGREKSLAWHFDKHGKFNVRSAYKVNRENERRNRHMNGGQGGSSSGGGGIRKALWKLICPSKTKHFLWRLSHNSHPLRNNLARLGMHLDTSCLVCERMNEDGAHLFFKCKLAKHVWRLLNLEAERTYLAAIPIPDAYGVVEYILKQQELKRELMAITLWFLWSKRNSIKEEGRRRPAEVLAQCIEMYMHENVQISSSTPAHSNLRRKKWTRPPNNVLKLNVDGSFRLENMAGSWGFLIRDSDGDLVLAGRGRVDNLLSAFPSELIACLQGLQSAADLGIGHLILESDAQEVVSALNSTVYDDSVLRHLIEEIKFQARLNFNSFVCVHVNRSCNQAAHELGWVIYVQKVMGSSLTLSLMT